MNAKPKKPKKPAKRQPNGKPQPIGDHDVTPRDPFPVPVDERVWLGSPAKRPHRRRMNAA
jgi:hypothetical protein